MKQGNETDPKEKKKKRKIENEKEKHRKAETFQINCECLFSSACKRGRQFLKW